MKAKLIKKIDNGWPVYSLRREDNRMIATTRWPFDEPALMIAKHNGIDLQKLSHTNCDEIFRVVDVVKLAEENAKIKEGFVIDSSQVAPYRLGFKNGFNKHTELNKDKVFTFEDMNSAMDWMMTQYFEFHEQPTTGRRDEYLKSLQQPTEIEVEIEMEDVIQLKKRAGGITNMGKPKLDSNGCLILKRAK